MSCARPGRSTRPRSSRGRARPRQLLALSRRRVPAARPGAGTRTLDVDDLEGAVRESARVLEPGGRLCLAIVHPINSAGRFDSDEPESPFVIAGSYLDRSRYADEIERDGLETTFVSDHRPLQAYADALADAGPLIERLREPAVPETAVGAERSRRWQRVPLLLHARAVKPGR